MRQVPSVSWTAVTVSVAVARCSNVALYWKITYSPGGAPGGLVTGAALDFVRDLNAPTWSRTRFTASCHFSCVTACLKVAPALVHESAYLPASTCASHAMAAVSAAVVSCATASRGLASSDSNPANSRLSVILLRIRSDLSG